MTEIIEIYNGQTNVTDFTRTDFFSNCNFVYLSSPDLSNNEELEIDTELNIFLTPEIQRKVELGGIEIMNTIRVATIPDSISNTGLNMQLILTASEVINLEIYAVRSSCCGQDQLNRIEQELLLIGAGNVIETVINLTTGGLFSGIIAGLTEVLPALLPGEVRSGFKIINPVENLEPILMNFGSVVSQQDYYEIIYPGQTFTNDFVWNGAISAMSLTGNPVSNIQIYELK